MLQKSELENAFNMPSVDRAHNLEELEPWSKEIAHQIASGEGIRLTPAHFEVIEAMRNYHQEYGLASSGRDMMKHLEVEFADLGGKKYLYGLFPRGPVTQCSRISGLPVPPNSVDRSFGTAM